MYTCRNIYPWLLVMKKSPNSDFSRAILKTNFVEMLLSKCTFLFEVIQQNWNSISYHYLIRNKSIIIYIVTPVCVSWLIIFHFTLCGGIYSSFPSLWFSYYMVSSLTDALTNLKIWFPSFLERTRKWLYGNTEYILKTKFRSYGR